MKRILWIVGLLLTQPTLGFAAADSSSGELLSSGMRVIGTLVLIIGLVLVIYALAKKRFKLLPGRHQGAIQVLEMRYLAPKKAVALVKVRGQELLLGIGQEQVNLLHRLDTPTDFETTLQDQLKEQA
ncbi:FliO/MopB family protein [Geothermobacter hydrogeniphilus]|uniref:Flagellar protein n=1 Tax=Geothermobacter hydrogeniphilus TaxID=1969733 RepID=A0A1X0YE67_9BACT|nr:flagellar biosynthetic protein FliO [Geothermobacter hydrogeniphilus]ORJ63511.1 hypothetical protein B5V00_01200 [Geothermobacter hydrogeniphilus]